MYLFNKKYGENKMEIMNMRLELDIIQIYTLVLFIVGVSYTSYVKTKQPSDFTMVLAYALIFSAACAPILARIFKVI